ncbi:unnamed protein product [Prunus brigantina]
MRYLRFISPHFSRIPKTLNPQSPPLSSLHQSPRLVLISCAITLPLHRSNGHLRPRRYRRSRMRYRSLGPHGGYEGEIGHKGDAGGDAGNGIWRLERRRQRWSGGG